MYYFEQDNGLFTCLICGTEDLYDDEFLDDPILVDKVCCSECYDKRILLKEKENI